MLLKSDNAHGGDIYTNKVLFDFSANTSPLGTPEFVKQSIIDSAENVLAYPDPYCNKVRQAISKYENIEKNFILCGNGAADIIFGFANALKPKNALIISPTFCEYEIALKSVDTHIEYYELNPKDNFALTDDILEKINPTIDVLCICNPNNPTGQLYSKDLMSKICEQCKTHNVMLFCDECFMDLTDNPNDFSLVDKINHNKSIFILKAFTKSFGMAGLRLGYALSSNETLLEKISSISQPWNISTIAQNAGCKALENARFLDEVRSVIASQRNYLSTELKNLGFEIFESKVNFILFKAESNLYEKLLAQHILIRKCENFKGLNDFFYRCAVKSPIENKAFIQALKERDSNHG